MQLISEHFLAVPVGLVRIVSVTMSFCIGMAILPEEARTQSIACNQLVADLAAQQKMIGRFRTLDYQTREHFLIVANAILSTYGGWNTKEGWASNAAQLRYSTSDYQQQAFISRRDIGRDQAIGEEELQRFNGAIDGFVNLIETGDKIAREIDDGRIAEANQIYFEIARPNYLSVHAEVYTLIAMAERRVASVARTPCS